MTDAHANESATAPTPDRLLLDRDGIRDYLGVVWPDRAQQQADMITMLQPGVVQLEMAASQKNIRPGGSLSGPTMMGLADQAAFMLCLAHLGDAAMAVTSHLSIEFLRRAVGTGLVVHARMEKFGRTQLTFTVRLHTPEMGEARPCAIATVGYSRALMAE